MKFSTPERPLLLASLIMAIPAFYLVLTEAAPLISNAGHWLYGAVAACMGLDLLAARKRSSAGGCKGRFWHGDMRGIDLLVMLGALVSAWPTRFPWPVIEWWLRLGYCGIVFVRLVTLTSKFFAPRRLLQVAALAMTVLLSAGAGFFWLEPRVLTYADGVWLAFITGATVGYGDLVPSTPASRIFAAFIVVLGYALFSVVTASIAALLVGEDEKRAMRGLHADMRLLREEIAALRGDLGVAQARPDSIGE